MQLHTITFLLILLLQNVKIYAFITKLSTGALLLDPTGGLPSPKPSVPPFRILDYLDMPLMTSQRK